MTLTSDICRTGGGGLPSIAKEIHSLPVLTQAGVLWTKDFSFVHAWSFMKTDPWAKGTMMGPPDVAIRSVLFVDEKQ